MQITGFSQEKWLNVCVGGGVNNSCSVEANSFMAESSCLPCIPENFLRKCLNWQAVFNSSHMHSCHLKTYVFINKSSV